jgi:hypothetical protein
MLINMEGCVSRKEEVLEQFKKDFFHFSEIAETAAYFQGSEAQRAELEKVVFEASCVLGRKSELIAAINQKEELGITQKDFLRVQKEVDEMMLSRIKEREKNND